MRGRDRNARTRPHARQGAFWRVLRGVAVEGEAWRDDSPTPCKIDLEGGTRYHKNMRKREKTQESKGEATKSAPGKRTAPKAGAPKTDAVNAVKLKKAVTKKKNGGGAKVNFLTEASKNIRPDPRSKTAAQIKWEDADFRYERLQELREAVHREDVDVETAIRDLFRNNKKYNGLCVWRRYNPRRDSFIGLTVAPKPSCNLFDENIAGKVKLFCLKNETHRTFYEEAIMCARAAQKVAEGCYRKKGIEELAKFLATRDDFDEVYIIISGEKKEDLLFIRWSLDRNQEMRKVRKDENVVLNVTAGNKQILAEKMEILEDFGLWKPSRKSDLNGLSEFAMNALLHTVYLMLTLKVPMRMLFRRAELAIEADKKAELTFTGTEVNEIIDSCPHEGMKAVMRDKYDKLIQAKTLLKQRDYAESIEALRPKS